MGCQEWSSSSGSNSIWHMCVEPRTHDASSLRAFRSLREFNISIWCNELCLADSYRRCACVVYSFDACVSHEFEFELGTVAYLCACNMYGASTIYAIYSLRIYAKVRVFTCVCSMRTDARPLSRRKSGRYTHSTLRRRCVLYG